MARSISLLCPMMCLCWWLASLGCAQADQASRLAHEAGAPASETESWMWVDLPEQRLRDEWLPRKEFPKDSLLPDDHELALRMNRWLSHFDAAVRAAYGAKLEHVPVPMVKVVDDEREDAALATVPVCLNVAVRADLSPMSAMQRTKDSAAAWQLALGRIDVHPEPAVDCLEPFASLERVEQVLAHYQKKTKGCGFVLNKTDDGRPQLAPDPSCYETPLFFSPTTFDRVVVYQPTRFVVVTTGMISLMPTEEEMASVLAHELGHYYGADVLQTAGELNYFYRHDEVNPLTRPAHAPELDQLGKELQVLTSTLKKVDLLRPLDGQLVRPEFYFAVGTYVRDICRAGRCSAACAAADEKLNDEQYTEATYQYPFAYAEETKEAYLAAEGLVKACLETIAVTSEDRDRQWQDFHRLVLLPTWPQWHVEDEPWRKQYTKELLSAYADVSDEYVPSKETKSMWDIVLGASAQIVAKYAQIAKHFERGSTERLGFYTAEQEADEQAVEYLILAGLEPSALIESAFTTMSLKPEGLKVQGHDLGPSECRKLYEQGFVDDEQREIFVSVGDYEDFHHGDCYRTFNTFREIIALRAANLPAPALSPPTFAKSWQDIRKLAGAPR